MVDSFLKMPARLLRKFLDGCFQGLYSRECDEKVVLHPRVSVLWSSAYLVELSGRIAPFKLHFAWDGTCRVNSCDHLESRLSSVMKEN